MELDAFWSQLQQLCSDHMPLPVLLAVAVLMLTPLLLFRWGKLTPFLEPERWKQLALTEKVVINHNTRRFRYHLL